MNEKEYKFDFTDHKVNLLYQDLITQAYDQYGADVYYIPVNQWSSEELDTILGEVKQKEYSRIYGMRMYLEDQTALAGQDIFSKFGLEIQDEAVLYVTRKEFIERLTGVEISMENGIYEPDGIDVKSDYDDNLTRPKEGDLVYIPMWNSLMEVTYVDDNEGMIHGHKSTFKLVTKKYRVGVQEKMIITDTGVGEAIHNEAKDITDVVNEIKDIEKDEDEARRDVNMDPTSTGFAPETTETINDDMQGDAEEIKLGDEEGDIFGAF